MERDFDVVVFGATGFTGGLVAEYFDNEYAGKLRWAIAGRSEAKLQDLKAELPNSNDLPILVADCHNMESLTAMARRTKVVCSVAGPYMKYGKNLVEACCKNGTHYCDLTGEPAFMRWSIDNWHSEAKETRAMIVHACGYDAIPSDLGTLMVADYMATKHQRRLAYVVNAALLSRTRGGVSGGTLASMRVGIKERSKTLDDPYCLMPAGCPRGSDTDFVWPKYDQDLKMFATFNIMAYTNSKVVRRTNGLLGMKYGEAFKYKEVLGTGAGMLGMVSAWIVTVVIVLCTAFMYVAPDFLLDAVLPKPSTGPVRKQMEKGRFANVMRGKSEDGKIEVAAKVGGQWDPGYLSTSKMLAESAVCLAFDSDLPGAEGGVLTPASAMGMTLVKRLREKGFTYEVTEA